MRIIASTIAPPRAPRGFLQQKRHSARSPGAPMAVRRRIRRCAEGETSVSTPLAIASVPDSGVKERVERVNGEVHDDHDRDDEEVDALDHGIVALVDGVEEESPHAGQAEDRLEDHGAAEDLRDLDAEAGDDGDEGVLQAVLEHHAALADSLRPRGTDVVLAQDVEQHRAGEAHDRGGRSEAEDRGREDELGYVRPQVDRELGALDGRAPAPPDRGEQHGAGGDPEPGHRESANAEAAWEVTAAGVVADGGY